MELLLLPERYIFELVRDLKKIDYGYLIKKTNFSRPFIDYVLSNLKLKQLIDYEGELLLRINNEKYNLIRRSEENQKDEIKDVLGDITEMGVNKKDSMLQFSLDSFWVDNFEKKVLVSKLRDLCLFLKGLDDYDRGLHKEKLFLNISLCNYKDLVHEGLRFKCSSL